MTARPKPPTRWRSIPVRPQMRDGRVDAGIPRSGAAATIARGYQYAALSPGRYGHRNRNAQVEAEGRRDIADCQAGHSWCLGTTAVAHSRLPRWHRRERLSDRASPMAEKTFAEILEDATNRSRDLDAPLSERLKAVADEVGRLSPQF